jgi:flagellar biosynthesis protein FlhF
MQLKRFRGRHLPDVMRQIREELGPEAVILHTKHGPRGLHRFLGGGGVEVLAAVDGPSAVTALASTEPASAAIPRASGPLRPPAGAPRVSRRSTESRDSRDDIRAQLGELRALLLRLGGVSVVEAHLQPLYRRLVAAGIEDSLAFTLVSVLSAAVAGAEVSVAAVEGALRGLVQVDSPPLGLRSGVVALVGPSGAGKTTTLAKLAALAHLDGAAVQLISLDDGGLGAPSPLETFGTIMGAAHTTAQTPEEVARAAGAAARRGLVLVDSPGVSPRQPAAVADLHALLRAAGATEIHLVLPATTKMNDAMTAIETFSATQPSHLLFTHLDETAELGTLLSVGAAAGLPLSYLSTGREVPTDIERATIRTLVTRALQGDDG